jgi:diketogulonate reductase-like aldo/keto reductase
VYQGFSLLTANVHAIETPALERIAARAGKTPAQVVFRFALEVGMIPITGTTSALHMSDDLGAFDFELTPDDVRTVETICR